MSGESDSGERTEEATEQKREDFRKKGQVAQTRELASALSLFGAILSMWLLGRFFLVQFVDLFQESVTGFVLEAARTGDYAPAMKFFFMKAIMLLAPIFGVFGLFSFASSVMQVGFLVNEEAMQPKVEKLNPVEGFKRIFSIRSVIEGMKAVVKVTLIGMLTWAVLKSEMSTVPLLIHFSVSQLMTYVGDVAVKLFGAITAFMTVLAALDFLFQKWDLEKKMKMTKQEVKEEHKSREGDPMIKARIRRIQREMSSKRMMADVEKADVIVTNPTHIAVALKYVSNEMVSPKIVAMGAGIIAEKIKEIAREKNIPVVENKPLARTMFKTLKIGQAIPRELFTAVAEVLSYVFRLKNKVVKNG